MESGFGESKSVPPPHSASCSGNSSNDSGDFECNICFDLAQDPIVTLCGHLYCWPCLYKWLYHHSHSHECPVCKAVVQEDKLVPLYGRGKTQSDPRSKSYPGIDIPNRPAGRRPQTAPPPPPDANPFSNQGLGGFMGVPMTTARIGNFTLSTAFGGLIPALFNVQYNTFSDATIYGTTSGYPYGLNHAFYGGHAHGFHQPTTRRQVDFLKNLFVVLGILIIFFLIW